MDWQLSIERNLTALKGILAALVAMAGLSGSDKDLRAGDDGDLPERRPTLPRHHHRRLLRLLRPAEAAARRLIIVASLGITVELPAIRPGKQQRKPLLNRSNGFGTGIAIRPGPLPEWARALAPKRSAHLSLPLFDPLKRLGVRRRYVKPSAAPRIRSFDNVRVPFFQPPRQPDPVTPTPHDPLDASRIVRRLDALATALDDLPRHAKRLALWRARRDAWLAKERDDCGTEANRLEQVSTRVGHRTDTAAVVSKPRIQRFSPLRPGRPPGWRRKPDHAVHHVLNDLHGLAVWAMERPDTS